MSKASPLTALKTTLELRANDDLIRVYVIKVATGRANEILKFLRNVLLPATDLQHLRRCARPDEVPLHLVPTQPSLSNGTIQDDSATAVTYLFLLLGRTALVDLSQVEDITAKTWEPSLYEDGPYTLLAPLHPPTSAEQARSWSSLYWPTVYKKSNPFGPHPSIISRAEQEVIVDLQSWMDMAKKVAIDSKSMGYGEAIGVVIVERGSSTSRAVALAGDGRWKGYEQDGVGNPMAHAVLRAIGMTAQKVKSTVQNKYENSQGYRERERNIFLDEPMLVEEEAIYNSDQVPSSHYLCHGLEIYVTHEPCVACSMAVLHSRFVRIVFGQRMPRTGGLCSESLGHGLFWRKELNWNMLAWQSNIKCANLDLAPYLHA